MTSQRESRPGVSQGPRGPAPLHDHPGLIDSSCMVGDAAGVHMHCDPPNRFGLVHDHRHDVTRTMRLPVVEGPGEFIYRQLLGRELYEFDRDVEEAQRQ